MKYFFIMGCPRSGTTLVQQILARHPEVLVPPETAFFTNLVTARGTVSERARRRVETDLGIALPAPGRLRDGDATQKFFARMANRYASARGKKAVWFGEKTPGHIFVADRVARLMPDARFLVVYRDGRDVAASLAQVPWAPADPLVCFLRWRQAVACQQQLVSAPPVDVMTLRYENLVQNPEPETRRVTDFLGLEFDSMLLRPSGAEGIPEWEQDWKGLAAGAIRTSRVGRWRHELDREITELMESWGGNELSELGYGTRPVGNSIGGRLSLLTTYLRWYVWRAQSLFRAGVPRV